MNKNDFYGMFSNPHKADEIIKSAMCQLRKLLKDSVKELLQEVNDAENHINDLQDLEGRLRVRVFVAKQDLEALQKNKEIAESAIRDMQAQKNNESLTMDDLRQIDGDPVIQADRDGRLVVLPCKIGDTVFTIEEKYFCCEECKNGSNAKYDPNIDRICCDIEGHCPLYIEEHSVGGFYISEKDNHPKVSDPGEWGYEGLETFSGIDGKWYLTRNDAEEAMKGCDGNA